MQQPIESDYKFEFDVEYLIETDVRKSHGFGIYLLDSPPEPTEEQPLDAFNGVPLNYKGLGVFLYRNNDDKWYLVAKQNNGL